MVCKQVINKNGKKIECADINMSSDLFSSEDTIAQMVRAISGLMRCLPAVVVVLVRFQVVFPFYVRTNLNFDLI